MRSIKRTPELAWLRMAALGAAFGMTSMIAGSATGAQITQTTPVQPTGAADHSGEGTRGDDPFEAAQQKTTKDQFEKRNKIRQEELVADTNKLLALATELKADVDKSDKDTLSVSVVRKSEEIEKLAKSVKDKMRNPH